MESLSDTYMWGSFPYIQNMTHWNLCPLEFLRVAYPTVYNSFGRGAPAVVN